MPDPNDPRTLPSLCHPFAVDPGMCLEDARFRPVLELRPPLDAATTAAELVVEIERRHYLGRTSQHAAG